MDTLITSLRNLLNKMQFWISFKLHLLNKMQFERYPKLCDSNAKCCTFKDLQYRENHLVPMDPNYTDNHGNTYLHLALMDGDWATVVWLLHHNANPNQANKNGVTPLYLGVLHNSPGLTRLLLDKGGDPRIGDKNMLLPLHFAARNNSIADIDALLATGSPKNPRFEWGLTPFFLAIQLNSWDAATRLIDKLNVNIPDNYGCYPLHWIVYRLGQNIARAWC